MHQAIKFSAMCKVGCTFNLFNWHMTVPTLFHKLTHSTNIELAPTVSNIHLSMRDTMVNQKT